MCLEHHFGSHKKGFNNDCEIMRLKRLKNFVLPSILLHTYQAVQGIKGHVYSLWFSLVTLYPQLSSYSVL